jgi:glycosyltransferase involved in cell wall biosynthesis
MNSKSDIKVIFVVNHLSFFASHWKDIVSQIVSPANVVVYFGADLSGDTTAISAKRVKKQGYILAENQFSSFSFNVLNAFFAVRNLSRILDQNPDAPVHAVSPMGIVVAGLAKIFSSSRARLLVTITGLGSIYSDRDARSFVQLALRSFYKVALRFVLVANKADIIVENTSDLNHIRDIVSGKIEPVVLPGTGIGRSQICYSPERKENIVLMPARVLRTKGINEFCQAAKLLRPEFPDWRFIVAGALDYKSPDKANVAELRQACDGSVEFPGHVEEIVDLFIESKIVCLPSYREGLPRALIEAAAYGCAVVTTDVAGCREAIIDNETGILVKVKCADSLASGLRILMQSEEKIARFAKNGIEFAYDKFDQKIVLNQLRKLYLE